MKYTIEGFSQAGAVKLGLTAEDLVILRWFVDYWPADSMVKMMNDGKEYGLVSYGGFIKQMPIISCNKRTIARKFQRLVDAGVLENATVRAGGTYSVYRFGPTYETLVENCTTGDKVVQPVVEECAEGLSKNVQPGLHRSVQPNTNLPNSTNLVNTSSCNTLNREQAPSWMHDPELSPRMISAISNWLEYKKERREGYKPAGLKALLSQIKNQVRQYGEEPVIDIMLSSMGSGYKGICFDKLKNRSWQRPQAQSGNPFMEILREEQEKKYGQGRDSEDFVTVESFVP